MRMCGTSVIYIYIYIGRSNLLICANNYDHYSRHNLFHLMTDISQREKHNLGRKAHDHFENL